MNLQKLFTMQQELDKHIEEQHPREEGRDRLAEKILALQVELGECANEWRGFKFWSTDQKARTNVSRYERHGDAPVYRNLLLEEYVDCLHFILSIVIEIGHENMEYWECPHSLDVTGRFIELIGLCAGIKLILKHGEVPIVVTEDLFSQFVSLGEKLGFTWAQIEEAYMSKNAVNHKRQEDGY